GTFSIREKKLRIGRNPKTGEKVHISEKLVPHFKAGKELRSRVDK
ncbi:MAG: HU family DNA-binding protein, partial [Methylophilaceae bacterium]